MTPAETVLVEYVVVIGSAALVVALAPAARGVPLVALFRVQVVRLGCRFREPSKRRGGPHMLLTPVF